MFGLIEKHGIDCWPVRSGLIFAAHSPAGRRDLENRTAYWQQRGAPVELLEGAPCADLIGSRLYPALSLDRRGGHINPFAYVRGLANAAVAAGATIHTATPVRGLRRDGARWLLDAGPGGLTADAVVIATNAYTGDLHPALRDSIIPMRGHGFVSEPVSDNLRASILPQRQSLTDTRHLFSAVAHTARRPPAHQRTRSSLRPGTTARLAPRRCTRAAAVPAARHAALEPGLERLGGDDSGAFPAAA